MGNFGEWLLTQLEERGWSQSELARRVGVTRQAIGRIINEGRKPQIETINNIAMALGESPTELMIRAGLLKEINDPRQAAVEILGYKLEELDDTQLDEVLQFIEFIQNRDDRRTGKGIKKTREGEAPPEAVKE